MIVVVCCIYYDLGIIMKKAIVSVVVNCDNTTYISRCFDSIVGQTFQDIEILMVSKDEEIKKYPGKDSRVRLFENYNELEITGEYVLFIKSTDVISVDWIRLLYNAAEQKKSDVVMGDLAVIEPNGYRYSYALDPIADSDMDESKDGYCQLLLKQGGSFFGYHAIGNKIFKKSLLNEIDLSSFFNKKKGTLRIEDLLLLLPILSHSNRITNCHGAYYYYGDVGNSYRLNANYYSDIEKSMSVTIEALSFLKESVDCFNIEKNVENEYANWLLLFGKKYATLAYNTNITISEKNVLIKKVEELTGKCIKEIMKFKESIFYDYKRDVSKEFDSIEQLKIKVSSQDIEYVSFDIFDTLIERPFYYPIDLFKLIDPLFSEIVSEAPNICFSKMRVESENNVRNLKISNGSSDEEVTIDEIYDYIGESYLLPKEKLESIKRIEKEMEIKYCKSRKIAKEIYELSKLCDKKIIVISDMYLDSGTINSILVENGYDAYTLYLSSELMLSKKTGHLYEYVMDTEGITTPGSVIHIGDNWHSDILQAQKIGFDTYYLVKATEALNGNSIQDSDENIFKKCFVKDSQFDYSSAFTNYVGLRCMWGVVANEFYGNPYKSYVPGTNFNQSMHFIGYCGLGMHMLSLSMWVISNAKDGSTIHFVARDGYVVKKIVDHIVKINNLNIKTNYLHISRRSLLIADVDSSSDIFSIKDKIDVTTISQKDLLNYLRPTLNNDDYKMIGDDLAANNHYSIKFKNELEYDKFVLSLIKKYGNLFDFNSKNKNYYNYFSKILNEGDVLFDMGYNGRAEAALSKIMGFPINSLYVHTITDKVIFRSIEKGFVVNSYYDYKPQVTASIREHIFMEMAPSTVGYDFSTGNLITEDYSIDPQSYLVTSIIQQSAIDFCFKMVDTFGSDLKYLSCRNIDSSMPFEYYLHESDIRDRVPFSNLVIEDKFSPKGSFNAFDFWSECMIDSKKGNSVVVVNNQSVFDYLRSQNHGKISLIAEKIWNLMRVVYVKLFASNQK